MKGDAGGNKIYGQSDSMKILPINKRAVFLFGNTLEKGYQYKVQLTYNIASAIRKRKMYL